MRGDLAGGGKRPGGLDCEVLAKAVQSAHGLSLIALVMVGGAELLIGTPGDQYMIDDDQQAMVIAEIALFAGMRRTHRRYKAERKVVLM